MERKPRVEVRCKEKHGSPTAVKRHVAATMAVFWLPACVRAKGLVRSLAPIDRLSLPITATLPAFYQTAVPGIDYIIVSPCGCSLPFGHRCRVPGSLSPYNNHPSERGDATMDE